MSCKEDQNRRQTTPTFIPSAALTLLPCSRRMWKGSLMDHRDEVFCWERESWEAIDFPQSAVVTYKNNKELNREDV